MLTNSHGRPHSLGSCVGHHDLDFFLTCSRSVSLITGVKVLLIGCKAFCEKWPLPGDPDSTVDNPMLGGKATLTPSSGTDFSSLPSRYNRAELGVRTDSLCRVRAVPF